MIDWQRRSDAIALLMSNLDWMRGRPQYERALAAAKMVDMGRSTTVLRRVRQPSVTPLVVYSPKLLDSMRPEGKR